MTSLPPRQKGLSLTNGTSLTKSYNGTLSVKWGQTFRIRHDQYSQTPPSGRNRYDVTSAQAKKAYNSLTVPARPKVTMEQYQ
jgi:hypothetical protein